MKICAGSLVYSKMFTSHSTSSPIDANRAEVAQLISVIVTTYNRSDALALVLMALAQQEDKNFELIIADDGSTDVHRQANLQCAQRLGLEGAYVWHPDVGFTASRVRNRGVAAARGDYLIFLDGDCVPETDFIAQHRRLRESGCYLNGSRVLLSPALSLHVLKQQEHLCGRGLLYWVDKRIHKQASKLSGLWRLPDMPWRKKLSFVWRGIRSCNMGVWRSDFELVNGFDESFVGWGHEDADFALRLHNAGIVRKNGFCATEVYHLWHPESSRLDESQNAQRVRQRQNTRQTMAQRGYRETLGSTDMVVNRWNA